MKKYILCCARVTGSLLIPDNKTGPCDVCGFKVQFRPHAPKGYILRCMQCSIEQMTKDDTLETTPQMVADAKRYFQKKLS